MDCENFGITTSKNNKFGTSLFQIEDFNIPQTLIEGNGFNCMIEEEPLPKDFEFLRGDLKFNQVPTKDDIEVEEMGLEGNSTDTESPKNGDKTETEVHTKDFLKFARRLAKVVKTQLASGGDTLVLKFLEASAQIINAVWASFNIPKQDICELVDIQAKIIQTLWNMFQDNLNYNKNKKICIVKAEHWNILFCPKTFKGLVIDICKNLKCGLFLKKILNNEATFNSFFQVLYSTNLLLTLTVILKDSTPQGGEVIRKIKTLDNFLAMMVVPELLEFYNHRSGKFAKECCGKCKICRGKNVPPNFLTVLQQARQRRDILISSILEATADFAQEEKIILLLSLTLQ